MSAVQDSCRNMELANRDLASVSRVSIALQRIREAGYEVFIASHSIEELRLENWPWHRFTIRISLYYFREGVSLPETIVASIYEALLLRDVPRVLYDDVLGDVFFLSVRLQNCLSHVGIKTIEEMRWVVVENIVPSSESRKAQIPVFPDMSRKSFLELRKFLKEYDEYVYVLNCS